MRQFICHTHLKILQEVPHPYPNIFSSNLNELEYSFWQEAGGGGGEGDMSPRAAATGYSVCKLT